MEHGRDRDWADRIIAGDTEAALLQIQAAGLRIEEQHNGHCRSHERYEKLGSAFEEAVEHGLGIRAFQEFRGNHRRRE